MITIHKQQYQKLSNIYLIGPMGSGKTTLGKQFGNLTGNRFYDSDIEIEKRTGADIPWIFKWEGEEGFRKREAQVIDSLCKFNNIILATGGGCILNEANRHFLSENGIVIYLTVSIETQLKRISRTGKDRPLFFIQHNSKKKLQELNEKRRPLYQGIADFIYQSDHLKPPELSMRILTDIKKFIISL